VRPLLLAVFGVQNYWIPEPSKEREMQQGYNLINAASSLEVQHFIYTSMGGCTQEAGPWRGREGTGIPQFESKRLIEKHLKESDMLYTILRPAFFMDNFWSSSSPWAHPGANVVMPFHRHTVQQVGVRRYCGGGLVFLVQLLMLPCVWCRVDGCVLRRWCGPTT
jgi:nucleoside-diphosphate-sugar epimerase